ncbi:hypothetical protein GN956_G19658 [Arapaima gigas]
MQRTLCVDPESHTLFLPGHGSPPNPHPGGGRKSPAKFNTFPASADSGDAKTNNRCSRPDGAEDTTADRHAIAKSTGVHASGNAVSSDLPTGGAPRGPEPEGRGAELLPPTAAVPKRTVAAPGAAGPTESIGLPRGRLRSDHPPLNSREHGALGNVRLPSRSSGGGGGGGPANLREEESLEEKVKKRPGKEMAGQ